MRRVIFLGVALGLAAPARAAQPPAAAPSPPVVAAAADPERLAAAERLVALVMPADAMRRIMIQGIPGMDMALEMSPRELGMGEGAGYSAAESGRSLGELGSAHDPHFRERMQIRSRVTGEVMSEMMGEIYPLIARASADYFARGFTLAELNELVALFSAPAGRKFSETWLGMTQDPFFTEMMRPMLPLMMRMGARIDERIRAASAHLPRLAPPPPETPVDVPEADAPEAGQ